MLGGKGRPTQGVGTSKVHTQSLVQYQLKRPLLKKKPASQVPKCHSSWDIAAHEILQLYVCFAAFEMKLPYGFSAVPILKLNKQLFEKKNTTETKCTQPYSLPSLPISAD